MPPTELAPTYALPPPPRSVGDEKKSKTVDKKERKERKRRKKQDQRDKPQLMIDGELQKFIDAIITLRERKKARKAARRAKKEKEKAKKAAKKAAKKRKRLKRKIKQDEADEAWWQDILSRAP